MIRHLRNTLKSVETNELLARLRRLRSIGITPPDQIILREPIGKESIVNRFCWDCGRTEWIKEIGSSPFTILSTNRAFRSLELIGRQLSIGADQTELFLLARRYRAIAAFCAREDIALSDALDYVVESRSAPHPKALPVTPWVPLATSTVEQMRRQLLDFHSFRNPFQESQDEHALVSRVRKRHSKVIESSLQDPLRPVVIGLLRTAAARTDALIGRPAGIECLLLISAMYGMSLSDAMTVWIGRPDHLDTVAGYIDLEANVFVKVIGNHLHPSGAIHFRCSAIRLPLLNIISRTILSLGSVRGEISSFYKGLTLADLEKEIIAQMREAVPGMKSEATSLHRSFDAAAVHIVGVKTAELSLIKGYPCYGAGAGCSYISAENREVVNWWNQTVDVVYGWAGLASPRTAEPSETIELQHGTSCKDLASIMTFLTDRVSNVSDADDVDSLIAAALGCIGARHRRNMPNPAASVRRWPASCFVVADKMRYGLPIGCRYIPLTHGVSALVGLCRERFGEASEFRVAKPVILEAPFPEAAAPFRTSFFNHLRKTSSDVVMQALVGHQTDSTWESSWLPIPNAKLFAEVTNYLEAALKDTGYNDLVDALEKASLRFPRLRGTGAPEKTRPLQTISPRSAGFRPLHHSESEIAARLLEDMTKRGLRRAGATTILALLFFAGVPLSLCERNGLYITFKQVVYTEDASKCYLLAPVISGDLGGLEYYPIELPLILGDQITRRYSRLRRSWSAARILETQLFTKDDLDQIAGEVIYYLPELRRIEKKYVRTFARRVSEHLCRWLQPGHAAAALSSASFGGINQLEIGKLIGGSAALRHLDGQVYSDNIKRLATRQGGLEGLREMVMQTANRHLLEAIFKDIVHFNYTIGVSTLARLINDTGVSQDRSFDIARSVLRRIAKSGKLRPTNAEPVINDASFGKFLDRIRSRSLDVRCNSSLRKSRTSYLETIVFAVTAIIESGVRISEAAYMDSNECYLHNGGRIYYIPAGKSPASRRPVAVYSPFIDLARAINESRAIGNKIDAKALVRTLRRLIQRNISGSPHDLRREYIWREIVGILAGRGNLLCRLGTLTKSVGHLSIHTTLSRYVGTRLTLMACPPILISDLADCIPEVSSNKLYRGMVSIYDGTHTRLASMDREIRVLSDLTRLPSGNQSVNVLPLTAPIYLGGALRPDAIATLVGKGRELRPYVDRIATVARTKNLKLLIRVRKAEVEHVKKQLDME